MDVIMEYVMDVIMEKYPSAMKIQWQYRTNKYIRRLAYQARS